MTTQETDRELLDLAALAAGVEIAWPSVAGNSCRRTDTWEIWNPLTDDGDALRLAADLRLQIKPGKHLGDGCTVESQRPRTAGATVFDSDKTKQMRRAIVLVAAEIGRAMKGKQ